MLFAVDFDEDFTDVERVAEALVFSLQTAGINCTEFDTPQTDRFSGYSDAPFNQEIFNVSVAQVEAIVEPDSIGNDIWWESVSFIDSHQPILPISATLFVSTGFHSNNFNFALEYS